MIRLLLALIFLALPAHAEEPTRIYIPDYPFLNRDDGKTGKFETSFIEIRESDEPGAVAEVEFKNEMVNSAFDDGDYALTWDGVTVIVRFQYNADAYGSDRIIITPPAGYACWPDCDVIVPERFSKIIIIFPGMS